MSLLQNLKLSASARKKAVLLPDGAFFLRVVPLEAGTQPADVPGQVELALEGLSPFSVAQLCYGYYFRPDASRVLVYAAYRRRFTVEDAEAWAEADSVLPAFAACLGLAPAGPEALLVTGPDFLTAIGWDGRDAVPAVVRTRVVAADAPAGERAAIRAELAAQLKDFPALVEVPAPTGTVSRIGDSDLKFIVGDRVSRFDRSQIDSIDVRDKAELAARLRDRARNLYLWRTFLGSAAAIVIAAVGQFGMQGGRLWLKSEQLRRAEQAPTAQKIETKQNLANRIEELSTRRLMPIRMLEIINEPKIRPKTIQFLRAATKGLYMMEVEGQTSATPDVFNYQAALKDLPACDRVELGQTTDRGGVTRFTLTVTFKPEALQPAAPPDLPGTDRPKPAISKPEAPGPAATQP